mmetsp:Transcript_22355/g.34290  ORF Transcript_22355/g.34290 Transcript_22355/m.34290 type:complete len:133 (-) Transcript_22355:572-970(-)
MAVAEALTKQSAGLYTCTMTRSGADPFQIIKLPPEAKAKLQHYNQSVDVRDADAVLNALRNVNASGVIFAASASKQGGNARDVDSMGVNSMGGYVDKIMDYKLEGERAVQSILGGGSSNDNYVIVRIVLVYC